MSSILKSITPHIIALLAFFIILFLFFKPAFEGKRLPQNDVLQGESAGKQGKNYKEKTGEEALWCTSMFSGMPAYMINTHYPGDYLMKLHYKFRGLFPYTADVVAVNFICMYIMLCCFGMRAELAFIGGFAYAFSPFTIMSTEAGHLYKVLAMGYFPLIIGGVKLIYDNKLVVGALLASLGTGLELVAQHYQITYYGIILILLMGFTYLFYAIKTGEIKRFVLSSLLLVAAALIGVGPSVARLWTTFEYNEYSIRGKKELTPLEGASQVKEGLDKDYAFSWSQGIWETMTYVIPNLYGGGSGEKLDKSSHTYKALRSQNVPNSNIKSFTQNVPTYWGDQPFTSGPMYAGITILALAILGVFTINKREKTWILCGIIILTTLSWGRNFESLNFFLFDHFPMYNKFRTVSMALSIVNFGLILLAILGVNSFLLLEKVDQLNILKKLAIAIVSIIGFVYFISLFLSFEGPKDETMKLPTWLLNAIIDDRKSMFHSSTFRSLLLSSLIIGVLYWSTTKKQSLLYVYISLSVLTIFDLWSVNKKYLSHNDFKKFKDATEVPFTAADRQILEDKDPNYRVFDLNNPFNNALTSYHHKSIGGYHGAKMQRYQDLIERHLSKNNQKVLDILNCKYIITNQPEQPVFERRTQNGNAWFVKNVTTVNSPDEEIEALNTFDQYNDAVIDATKFKTGTTTYSKDENASIKLETYKPNHLTYTATNTGNGLALFSEIYYAAGWNAYIDGTPTNHIRCNYILRGLEIPAGTHKVEFKFEPQSYHTGNKISLIASILVFSLLLGAVGWEVKKELKKA